MTFLVSFWEKLVSFSHLLPSLPCFQALRSETGWKQVGKSREDFVREKLDLFYFKIHSLDPDSYYQVELTAHNAIGWSKPSFLVLKTAPGKNDCFQFPWNTHKDFHFPFKTKEQPLDWWETLRRLALWLDLYLFSCFWYCFWWTLSSTSSTTLEPCTSLKVLCVHHLLRINL